MKARLRQGIAILLLQTGYENTNAFCWKHVDGL